MTLKQYKKFIDKLVKDGHGDKTVVYASDDEGNGYDVVKFSPSVQEVKDCGQYLKECLEQCGEPVKDCIVCIN